MTYLEKPWLDKFINARYKEYLKHIDVMDLELVSYTVLSHPEEIKRTMIIKVSILFKVDKREVAYNRKTYDMIITAQENIEFPYIDIVSFFRSEKIRPIIERSASDG